MIFCVFLPCVYKTAFDFYVYDFQLEYKLSASRIAKILTSE